MNRGNRGDSFVPEGAHVITADIKRFTDDVEDKLAGMTFRRGGGLLSPSTTDHIKRDIELFEGRCDQYIFISSASAYQKPLSSPVITESTPLYQPLLGVQPQQDRLREKADESVPQIGLPCDHRAPQPHLRRYVRAHGRARQKRQAFR